MAESPSKKHKKHKKHKHKKHHDPDGEEDVGDLDMEYLDDPDLVDEDIDVISPSQPAIKLKIKLGSQTVGTTSDHADVKIKKEIMDDPDSVPDLGTSELSMDLLGTDMLGTDVEPGLEAMHDSAWEDRLRLMKGEDVFLTKKPGEDTSDEEQEWLDALEAGTLDDSGALKRCKDPSLMTARQRALVHGKREGPMMELPSGYKTAELTEEQLQRRQQRAKKRREMAYEKVEKDKKQTLDRLLKKQDAKLKGSKMKGLRRMHAPCYRYTVNQNRISVSVPQGFQFPLSSQKAPKPREPELCGATGCTNRKKYSCSKTGVPLCSLNCYKTNLSRMTEGTTARETS